MLLLVLCVMGLTSLVHDYFQSMVTTPSVGVVLCHLRITDQVQRENKSMLGSGPFKN